MTGMAIQALSKYQDYKSVKTAIEKAVHRLSQIQEANGGFTSMDTSNLESTVQVLMALCELGVDMNDSRFVKNGNTVVDNLLTYYQKGGGFKHTANGSGEGLMSTEQGLYALVNVQRVSGGKTSLYNMSGDKQVAPNVHETQNPSSNAADGKEKAAELAGLQGKNKAVKAVLVATPGKTFADIKGHPYQTSIEALAARRVINGMTDTEFAPDVTMTRAQFAPLLCGL